MLTLGPKHGSAGCSSATVVEPLITLEGLMSQGVHKSIAEYKPSSDLPDQPTP